MPQLIDQLGREALEEAGVRLPMWDTELNFTRQGTENEWESFREDIADLYDGSIGTLVVPGSGTYTNTCFTGVPGVSEQKAAEPNGSGTAQWTYEITMEILHL